jgi:hypothetical protein
LGINFSTIYRFIDCRSSIQASLAKAGIVATVPEIDFNSDDVFDNIIRIKKCIHAGFKNNLAYLMDNGVTYKTNTGLTIIPNNLVVNPKPKKIIYGSLKIKIKNPTIFYEPTPIFVCSMDGII